MGLQDKITIVRPATEEQFEQHLDMRWRLLRAPWGQPRGSEIDDQEESAEHVSALADDGRLVGVGRVHFVDEQTAQIRYMAVDEAWRRSGVGCAILRHLEDVARARGVQRIVLNARTQSASFYASCGYERVGKGHTLFGVIRHWRMSKRIQRSSE